jgi:hypothetical protein
MPATRTPTARRPGRFVRALAPLIAALAFGIACSSASAVTESATLHASFDPNRLGVPTTITFGFHIATSEGVAPPPMTALDLQMPAGMNYTTTTLGLATCRPAALLTSGLAGCPANSRLGYGTALVEVPFGSGAGHEIPELQAVMGPSSTGNLVVLFYANGLFPVSAQLTFQGEVLPDSGAYGSQLSTQVPLVTSVPGGPDVSIVDVESTIGPQHLTYYKHVHGHRVAFKPQGVSVPERCPRDGFPFAAHFTFLDGSETTASTTIPCPPKHRSA